jgi:hypothetical protein
MVERGKLTRDLERLIEGGVDRSRQSDAVGDRRQGGKHGERVGSPHDVEVVDPAMLLAQPQALGQEEEVELCPLGCLGQFDERREFNVAPGGGVAPHRGVVDAGEVRRQVHLLGARTRRPHTDA